MPNMHAWTTANSYMHYSTTFPNTALSSPQRADNSPTTLFMEGKYALQVHVWTAVIPRSNPRILN